MAEILVALLGLFFALVGMIALKYPKFYLEFSGARILILFRQESRVEIVKLIGIFTIILGFVVFISGITGYRVFI